MKNITEVQPLENNILHIQYGDSVSFNVDIKPFIKSEYQAH